MERIRTREAARIALPAILESLVLVIIATVDTKMISSLGHTAITAVGLTTQPKLLCFAVFYALGTASSFFIAQAGGSGDRTRGNAYFHAILRITVFLSVVLGIVLGLFARPVMQLFNRQPESVGLSADFFAVVMGCMVFQTLSIVLNGALRGIGETRVTLYSSLVLAGTDILFNYLLIQGRFGFPRLEVVGDAIATVLGNAAACAVSLFYLKRKSGFLTLKGVLRPVLEKEITQNIRKKAGSIVFENLFVRIGFMLTSVIVSTFPADQTSVYFVGMILLQYSFAFGDGLQAATISLTGKSIGAGSREDFRAYFRIMISWAVILSVALSTLYLIGARWFFCQYFSDPVSIEEGFAATLHVIGITAFQIMRIVFIAGLRGMGEVRDPRRIAILCVLLLNPGMSCLLAYPLHMGIRGIWAASVLTQMIWMILAGLSFKKHTAGLSVQ